MKLLESSSRGPLAGWNVSALFGLRRDSTRRFTLAWSRGDYRLKSRLRSAVAVSTATPHKRRWRREESPRIERFVDAHLNKAKQRHQDSRKGSVHIDPPFTRRILTQTVSLPTDNFVQIFPSEFAPFRQALRYSPLPPSANRSEAFAASAF